MYVWLFKKMPNCFLSDCTIFCSRPQRVRVVVDAHLVLAIFFILAILTGVHVVVSHCGLICISWRLMRNTISWVCWTIFLGPFLSFLIRYWVVIIFYILSTQVLGRIYVLQVFLPLWVVCFLSSIFWWEGGVNFNEVQCINFFVVNTFCILFKKSLPEFPSWHSG